MQVRVFDQVVQITNVSEPARFFTRFLAHDAPVHMALKLPLRGRRPFYEKVIYVELDLLLRDRS